MAPDINKKPKIVCLCGFTRFRDEFQVANYEESMKGNIVLSVGFYAHRPETIHAQELGCTPEQKIAQDELHKRKIDISDEVYVLNINGYIGDSTRSEIDYAIGIGVPVRYKEQGPKEWAEILKTQDYLSSDDAVAFGELCHSIKGDQAETIKDICRRNEITWLGVLKIMPELFE